VQTALPNYHLLAKPAGAACNLGCKYCFFLSKENLYPPRESPLMDEATLVETSDIVLTATVLRIETGAPDQHGALYTYVHLAPDRVLKGHVVRETVVLREPGGQYGDTVEWVYGAPQLAQ